jgi:hypothetical protein
VTGFVLVRPNQEKGMTPKETAEAILAAPDDVNDFDSKRDKFLDSLQIPDLKGLAKAYLGVCDSLKNSCEHDFTATDTGACIDCGFLT